MDYKESKIQRWLHWVYLVMCIHGLWVIGFLIGAGVLGLIPTTVTAYELMREAADPYTRERVKIFSLWRKQFKKNFMKYRMSSLLYSVYLFILAMNYTFLGMQTSLLTLILFYVVLFLFLFSLVAFLWFSFIAAEYPHLKQKEMLQNAIAFPLSRMLEMIISFTLLFTLLFIIWEITPGLVVFTGVGIVILMTYWVFMKIHDGFGVHLLFDSLKQNNKTV